MSYYIFFFFNAPATTEIYTLSLHDALPILAQGVRPPRLSSRNAGRSPPARTAARGMRLVGDRPALDRKSTRLNSSHSQISYAVFCLKKKKKKKNLHRVNSIQYLVNNDYLVS